MTKIMRNYLGRLTLVVFAAIFPILCASAADQPVSFSGTWNLDSKESEPFLHPVVGLTGGLELSRGNITGDSADAGTLKSRDMGGGGMQSGGGMGMAGGRGAQAIAVTPPLVIRQSETGIEISRITKVNDKEVSVFDKYKVDGREDVLMVQVPNTPNPVKVTTKATLKKGKFVINMINHHPNGKIEMKREYSLSKDGKTLTLNTTNTTMKGQLVQKQVYHKQDAN
jgi:hypothetical protein